MERAAGLELAPSLDELTDGAITADSKVRAQFIEPRGKGHACSDTALGGQPSRLFKGPVQRARIWQSKPWLDSKRLIPAVNVADCS
jgi:hypothetical protein